jgi:nucleoside-diphosphate-sugar epimerase
MQEVIHIMEERTERGTVMVTGATGQQGGAVARHLLETGFGVRALVRDLQKPRVKTLAERGIELVQGGSEKRISALLFVLNPHRKAAWKRIPRGTISTLPGPAYVFPPS